MTTKADVIALYKQLALETMNGNGVITPTNTMGVGYDVVTTPNIGSTTTLESFTSTSGVLSVGATSAVLSNLDTTLKVGQEITIYDDVNLERKIVTSVDIPSKTIGFSALVNSYKNLVCICRSSISISAGTLSMGGWGTTGGGATSIGTKLANPATLPGGNGFEAAFHPNGNWVAIAQTGSPYFSIYAFNSSMGTIGARSSTPSSIPSSSFGAASDIAFHPNGNFVAVITDTSPYIYVYQFNSSSGVIGAKITDPAVLPPGSAQYGNVTFHPNGNWMGVTYQGSPYMSIYAFNPSTGAIGAKSANPATLPAGSCYSINFSPNGNFIALAHNGSPFISVYAFNSTTGVIGVKSANPVTLPSSTGNSAVFHPNGNWLALADGGSPYLYVYAFNSATGVIGAMSANPVTLPAGFSTEVNFSPDGLSIAVSHQSTPFVSVYPFNPTTGALGTKLANPATLVTGSSESTVFHPNGNYLAVAHQSAPFLTIYYFIVGTIKSPVPLEDFRYKVTGLPNGLRSISAFLEYADILDDSYRIDAAINCTDLGINETYTNMTRTTSVLSSIKESKFTSQILNKANITIRFTITRALALTFDGVNDYVNKPGLTAFNRTGTQELTVEAWVYFTRLGGQYQTIIGNRKDSDYNWMLYQHTADGSLQLHGTAQNKSTYTPPLNTWTHIAATVTSGGLMTIYGNGQSVFTVTGYIYAGPLTSEFSIGAFTSISAAAEPFQGKIRDVRVWTIARTQAQIQANMNSQLVGNESGLAGYWRLNESTGTIATDLTVNANHLTLTNGPTPIAFESTPTKLLTIPI